MKQKYFYSELAYLLGILILPLGAALMEAADFGLSMVVAPAYLTYLKLSQTLPFFTFGMAEYCLQAVILLIMTIVLRRFRRAYLFSFVTAVLYGVMLDIWMRAVFIIPRDPIYWRVILYVSGLLCCSAGVALFFHTYISPEAYELFVKEISDQIHMPTHRFKTFYDIASCIISILLSFLFFGWWHFEGVKFGTILCAMINGIIIGRMSRFMDKRWIFRDAFRWRAFFSK